MSATFTDDDLEKRVENANGEVIGTVTAIDDDTARVEPRAGVMDSIRAALGWGDAHDDTVSISEERVDEISSEAIRLRTEAVDEPADVPTEAGVAASATAERDPGTGDDDRDASDDVDALDDATARTATERSETPEETSPIEPLEDDEAGATEAGGERSDATESTDSATDGPDDAHRPDAPGEPGLDHATTEIDETESTDESASEDDESDRRAESADETAASPDAMSGSGSTEPAPEMDRAGVSDAPDDELPESPVAEEAPPSADAEADSPETAGIGPTAGTDRDEPSERDSEGSEPAADETTATEETDLTEELDTGVDLEAAAETADDGGPDDATGSDEIDGDDIGNEVDTGIDLEAAAEPDETDDRDRSDERGGEGETDLAEELDTGVDLESAASAADADSRADARPETELDDDVEPRSGPDDDPRPETTLEAPSDGSAAAESGPSGGDVVPGVDIDDAVAGADASSGPEIDPDAVAGPESGTEPADAELARERTGAAETADESEERAARERIDEGEDRTAGGREASGDGETKTRAGDDSADSPLAAAVAAQRAALTGARVAVETPLLVQRQGLEVAEAATRSYFDALAALTGVSTRDADSGGEPPASPDELLGELEDAAELADDEFEAQLSAQLEGLRAMRSHLESEDASEETAAALLDRQIELLEGCRERLNGDGD